MRQDDSAKESKECRRKINVMGTINLVFIGIFVGIFVGLAALCLISYMLGDEAG
jgi:hypothetical protein